MAERFIKLYDKILKWEWYKNTNVKVLFLHLLLRANYKDASFEGHRIMRGQLVTSLPSLVSETGLTVRQIRSSLEKLILTGELTSKTYPRYRVITIVHYDEYQSDGRQNGSQMTGEMAGKRQARDRLVTGKRQADDSLPGSKYRIIEQIEDIEKIEQIEERGTAKRFTPPTAQEVLDFCIENRLGIDVDRFMDYYASKGWVVGKSPMKDWKAAVRNWAARDKEQKTAQPKRVLPAQDFEQRSYDDVPQDDMARLAAEMRKAREAGEFG